MLGFEVLPESERRKERGDKEETQENAKEKEKKNDS